MKLRLSRTPYAVLVLAVAACASTESAPAVTDDPHQPYEDGQTTIIGGVERMPIATGTPNAEGCLQVTTSSCVTVTREGRYCSTGSGPVDAVVVDGEIVEVVCYEDTDGTDGTSRVIDTDQDGDVDVPQQDNGAVLTFDAATDGKPIPGSVTIDGNDVTLYGRGPDKSIIEGDLVVTGNNARIRGIRVKGNVEIALNTAAIVLSVVEGDLRVTSNNSLVAEVDVFGALTVTGNNTVLVSDDVAGKWQIEGRGATCSNDFAFSDENADLAVQVAERGDALACPAE